VTSSLLLPLHDRLRSRLGTLDRAAATGLAAAFLTLSACRDPALETPETPALPARVAWLEPPAPLDRLAEAAANALLARPGKASLAAWNGLERLGVRLERPDWVQVARERFAARLADPRPLAPGEALAFRERWTTIQPDPGLRERLEREGWSYRLEPPDPWRLLETLRPLVAAPPGPELLAAWGRVHAWFGHLWLDGDAAIGFDGLRPEPAGEGLWRVRDLLGVEREFTARRRNDHASMRWIEAGGSTELPARFPGEG